MRRILMATTALVGVALAGSAQAAAPTSPISLNVGGYVDFVAGFYHQSAGVYNESSRSLDIGSETGVFDMSTSRPSSRDFETEF